MNKIKLAIIGIGNCASSLIQGISYYSNSCKETLNGLMHWDIGGYKPEDMEVVIAFDVDERKVGAPLTQAIFTEPNNTTIFCHKIVQPPIVVQMGCVLDGVSDHFMDYQDRACLPYCRSNRPNKR